jgi:hypothetical protein
MKTIVDLRNDMFEVFEPITMEDYNCLSVQDLGALVTINTTTGKTFLESERLVVMAGDKVYNLNRDDFTHFRINSLEDRCFTYKEHKLFKTLFEAIQYGETLRNEVVVIVRDVFKDENGDFTDVWYYASTLEA